jgi:hypothetical protein
MYYGDFAALRLRKNKADSRPSAGNPKIALLTEHDSKKQSQFPGGQINVTFFRKTDYEKQLVGGFQKTNSKQSQFRNNPKAWICPGHLLINRMSRIRCVCGLEVLCAPGAQAESAKMARESTLTNSRTAIQKKPNFLQ